MTDVIKDWDAFEVVAVPLGGALPLKSVKRGRPVSVGESLARHPGPLKGDVHSSVNGLVLEITEAEIVIRRDEDVIGKSPAPLKMSGLAPSEVAQSLKMLGLDVPEVCPGDPFIIQSFDAEPGLGGSAALFDEQRETVLAGLAALNALYPDYPLVWAVSDDGPIPQDAEFQFVRTDYPHSLPALVKSSVTGRRASGESGIFSGRDLYMLGRVWRTGLPLARLPLTLDRANYFVPLGARIIDLLTFANLRPGPADSVIKGGLVRGLSASRLGRGLGKNDAALHLARGGRGPWPSRPCRGCGECGRACPAGLDVPAYGRLDQRQWLSEKFTAYRDCLLCGACALACPAHRPLLSLARLQAS